MATSSESTADDYWIDDWVVPPPNGFRAEDLDRLHDPPRRPQLIDGSLVFATPQANFHRRMVDLVERSLEARLPEGLLAIREMTVTLGPRQRPEPDVMVVRRSGYLGDEQATFLPADVVLVVEVVSVESQIRDRERKPQLYAAAGIEHFWLIERTGGRPAVHVYELDPVTRYYVPTGIHRDRVSLTVPFPLEVDLSDSR